MTRIYGIVIPAAILAASGIWAYVVWPGAPESAASRAPGAADKELAELKRNVQDLRAQLAELRHAEPLRPAAESPASPPGQPANPADPRAGGGPRSLEQRFRAIESSMAAIQSAMDGISIEKASAERQALFAAEEGYLKADEYFEAGKFAIAGEGYLTFLQHHPDHADAREVMKKARNAFLKAGYKDKAFWVQDEMIKRYPQFAANDLWEQAQLEKEAGLYDAAVRHAAQAAELTANIEERLWRRLYWAYYVEVSNGTAAGIAAYLQVQQEILASGVTNPRLIARAQEKLLELQRKRQ